MGNKKKILTVAVIAALAVIAAVITGIVVYNNSTPVRLSRQLELGQKYLTEQDYDQAIVAFQVAIEIDPMSTEAYLGMAVAYVNLGDNEKAIEVLTRGYEETGQNAEIKVMLIEVYLDIAMKYVDAADYEKALVYYDILLELDGENMSVLSDLEACLTKYLEILMAEGRYEEIRQLHDKYAAVVPNVDFQKYISEIEEIERIAAENKAFMQQVYDLMEAKDYEEIQTLETSEEMQEFLGRMEEDRFIYIPEDDDSLNGTGAGVYCLDEGVCCFFYGQYEDGIRSGVGTVYNTNDFGGYSEFVGEWKEDAPNGQGTLFFQRYWGGTGDGYQEIFSGNLVNGLFDGPMKNSTLMSGLTYDMSCNANMGVPEDRTGQLLAEIPYVAQMIPKDNYVYAFDHPSGNWYFAIIGTNSTMGVIGYRTE